MSGPPSRPVDMNLFFPKQFRPELKDGYNSLLDHFLDPLLDPYRPCAMRISTQEMQDQWAMARGLSALWELTQTPARGHGVQRRRRVLAALRLLSAGRRDVAEWRLVRGDRQPSEPLLVLPGQQLIQHYFHSDMPVIAVLSKHIHRMHSPGHSFKGGPFRGRVSFEFLFKGAPLNF